MREHTMELVNCQACADIDPCYECKGTGIDWKATVLLAQEQERQATKNLMENPRLHKGNEDKIRFHYYERICNATNRFEAGDLLRAWACASYVTDGPNANPALLSICEKHARALQDHLGEEDYVKDPDGPGYVHPWREWMKEWGWGPAKDRD